METEWTQGKGSILPCGIAFLADPEHLNHQKEPLEENDESDNQHHPLLRGPGSNTHDGEDDGETCGPNGAVVEPTDCDRCMSGRRNESTKGAKGLPI